MRVLLVYPAPPRAHWPLGSFRSRWLPTGIACIATALRRAGHDVRAHVREEHLAKCGFDWQAADAQLRGLLEEFRPEIVGFSVLTPGVAETETIAALAKQVCGQGTLTVAGGVHPSAVPERMFSDCPSLDLVVVGEGETALCELTEQGPSASVAGLVIRTECGAVHGPPRPPTCDLDSLGPPAYDLFDMGYYTAQDRWLLRWLPLRAANVRTSRGCPNKCRFCAGHVASGVGVRFHSIEYVVSQIGRLVDTYGIEAVRFEDDTLGADAGRLRELCAAIRAEGLHERIVWDGCLRVDQAEPGLLAAMRSAGCIQVEYGFESGSDEMLRRLGKSASLELNRRAVTLTREAGLRIFADIMVGLPDEKEADLRATVDFIRWANPEVLSASRLCPLPGTPIYDALPAETREAIDWGEYSYDDVAARINLTAMSDERWRAVHREFSKYFVRPKVTADLLRDTPQEWTHARRALRRRLLSFALRHPLRALRLPRTVAARP